jgi:hypothetical protein
MRDGPLPEPRRAAPEPGISDDCAQREQDPGCELRHAPMRPNELVGERRDVTMI